MVWRNYLYNKPAWVVEYEFHEHTLVRRSGLSKEKLREITKLFMEYKVLEEDWR